ncbi:MAG TPA: RES domain-containing protein [Gammaproteobacteria bacterium]|nr:RES domain-containing protein [Gammaproteobacteria bacterium]
MEMFRVVEKPWSGSAFDGEGASICGGRWNNKGTAMVYAASTRALAILELLVHLEDSYIAQQNFVIFRATINDSYIMDLGKGLPNDWQSDIIPLSTQAIGDDWARQQASAVLEVPSAIIPEEKNYLINPLHSDFKRLMIDKAQSLLFDPRLVKP